MAFVGTGTSITFPTGFTACILEISGPSASRESVDFTCMDDSAKNFRPSTLVDWGEVTVSIAFDPSDSITGLVSENKASYVIEFGDDSAGANSSWTFDGFCTGFDPTTPLEDRATADVTIKVSGTLVKA